MKTENENCRKKYIMYIFVAQNEKKSHLKRKNCTKYAKNGLKCQKFTVMNSKSVFKQRKKSGEMNKNHSFLFASIHLKGAKHEKHTVIMDESLKGVAPLMKIRNCTLAHNAVATGTTDRTAWKLWVWIPLDANL